MLTLLGFGALLVVVLAAGSSSSACVSCHAMRPYAPDDASAHAAVGCYRCHLENGTWDWPGHKSVELLRMYPATLFGGTSVRGMSAQVSSKPCLDCHDGVFKRVTERNGLRVRHETCVPDGNDCSACHSAAIHGSASRWARQPVMEDCVACHRRLKAPADCDTCHQGRSESERLARGPWQVTHGARWKDTHGMGALEYCSTCHPDDYCVACHGIPMPHTVDFGRIHGALSTEPGVECAQCHKSREFCDDCHVHEMPHPADFLPNHSSIAVDREDTTCLSCHPSEACWNCHEKHAHPGMTEGTLGGGGAKQ